MENWLSTTLVLWHGANTKMTVAGRCNLC